MKSGRKAGAAGAAIMLAAAFIAPWEGLWTTAKIDTIGTGRPPTVCYGATRAEIPNLKVGQKFTKQQCDALLEKSIPKYWNGIQPCVHVALPDKVKAALISMSYNAGPGAVCKSVVVSKLNAGQSQSACAAIKVWYIRARGVVVKGLVNRRAAESNLCLEGVAEGLPKPPSEPSWLAQFFAKLNSLRDS